MIISSLQIKPEPAAANLSHLSQYTASSAIRDVTIQLSNHDDIVYSMSRLRSAAVDRWNSRREWEKKIIIA